MSSTKDAAQANPDRESIRTARGSESLDDSWFNLKLFPSPSHRGHREFDQPTADVLFVDPEADAWFR